MAVRDFFPEMELRRKGFTAEAIAFFRKLSVISDTISRLNSTAGDVDDAATAILALQSADTALDSRLDALEADAPYVSQDVGPAWGAASGTLSRAAFASWTAPTISNPPTQAEVQSVADQVQLMSRAMAAIITDLRDNHALTP